MYFTNSVLNYFRRGEITVLHKAKLTRSTSTNFFDIFRGFEIPGGLSLEDIFFKLILIIIYCY